MLNDLIKKWLSRPSRFS